MEVRLFKFNKPHANSTARPDPANADFIVECKIVDNASSVCDIVLSLPAYNRDGTEKGYSLCNYCYIPKFLRYYWVWDWQYTSDGVWRANCSVDVLASFKYNILGSSGYVTRTSNPQYYDKTIIDTMFPAKCGYYIKTVYPPQDLNPNPWFTANPADGVFVISTVSTTEPVYGAINYYVLPSAQFRVLVENMVSNGFIYIDPDDWKSTNFNTDVLKSIVSPMQYLKSCLWFPLRYSYVFYGVTDTPIDVYFGPWNSGAKGYKLNSSTSVKTIPIGMFHAVAPDDATQNYSLYPPYATYTLYNSLFGTIALDGTIMSQTVMVDNVTPTPALKIEAQVNLITGKCLMNCYIKNAQNLGATNYEFVSMREYDISADIPISDVSYNYVNATKSAVSALGTAGDWKAWLTSPGSQASGIINSTIDAACFAYAPTESGVGNAKGGFYSDIGTFIIVCKYTPRSNFDVAHYGLPCNKLLSFNALDGWYMQATETNLVSYDGTSNTYAMLKREYDEILDFIKRGIFLV